MKPHYLRIWSRGLNNRAWPKTTKAAPLERRLCPRPPGEGRAAFACRLRQVIAERGENHVVHGLRGDWRCSCAASRTGPSDFGNVGVLDTPLDSALWTGIGFVPEAKGSLLDKANVASAGRAGRRVELVHRHAFRGASRVVRGKVAVAAVLVK